ncbi:MAG TPA: hypothetical protein VH539_04575 [Gemmatimonadaceae bacterium]|jgi:hypothetical protein
MTTPLTRAAVSFAALAATLALGACARGASPATWDGAAGFSDGRFAIGFENEAQTYVDVYYIDERREWWLGRVAPGALTSLTIPGAALSTTTGFVRLGILANTQRTLHPMSDARTILTIPQPVGKLMAQQWTYRQTPLATPEIFGKRRVREPSTR